jgi:anti-sigma regulatory factor (Ser/Thr protein kinase)
MAAELNKKLNAPMPKPLWLSVSQPAEIKRATDAARKCARELGFRATDCEEIALVVSELASNALKHAGGGSLELAPLQARGRTGLGITCEDKGRGIGDPESALTDGYSTAGSLGIGLGTVNRLMDDLEFNNQPGAGLRVVCHRWIRPKMGGLAARSLEFGAATRPCHNLHENGDAFVIKCWEEGALAGVLDGLGHGPLAQRASHTARQYIEQHFDQPLENLFLGVERACRATRGVVMALARFDLRANTLTLANVGNVEVRTVMGAVPLKINIRRGVLGLNAPKPLLTQHSWSAGELLIIHSDGVTARWQWDEFADLAHESARVIAAKLLAALGRNDDDATVLVIRNAKSGGAS